MARPASPYFSNEFFKFLSELKRNNDRGWFTKNKGRYEAEVQAPALRFIADAGPKLRSLSSHLVADPKPFGGSLSRIHRDTRFSKDKSPYHARVGIHFWHDASGKAEAHLPGFFLHIEPGESGVYSGVWRPESAALKAIRDSIVKKPSEWKKATKGPLELYGESLKRAPPGYDPGHALVEDLKRKDFVGMVSLPQRQLIAGTFMGDFLAACQRMDPLNRFVSKAMGVAW